MADQNTKRDNHDQGGISPVAAGVAGAVVGAGVAVAATVALKDEENRKKVNKVINHVKNQAAGYLDDMQKQADDMKDEAEKKLAPEKSKQVTAAKKDK